MSRNSYLNRQETSALQYRSSPLRARNKGLALAARLRPVRAGAPGIERFAARTTSAADFISGAAVCDSHLDCDREACILVVDDLNPGEFNSIVIYDYFGKPSGKNNLSILVIHDGTIYVKPDTVIYWR